MPVDALLDGMTAVDLTAVRRAIAYGRGKGNILFRCAQCNSPVYLPSAIRLRRAMAGALTSSTMVARPQSATGAPLT